MSPFLTLPVILVNNEQQVKETQSRIQPNQIEYYYPGFNEGSIIVMKSGSSFMTPIAETEIDNMLIAYEQQVKKSTGKFGILSTKN
jgi:hypothetical protein